MQAKVGPTSPPDTGRSAIAPENKSMSSTSLETKYVFSRLFSSNINRLFYLPRDLDVHFIPFGERMPRATSFLSVHLIILH
jgi:hypothetical protein